ncbi:hypothetical protein DL98DRAFT_612350 [Cadophora sp. DSE1049]|nr:hypothetical protein DL98DRAFT_612350 [Cadophora sp. DSE1049]
MEFHSADIDHFDGPAILLFGLKGTGRISFINKVTGHGSPRTEEPKTTEAIICQVGGHGTRVAFIVTPSFDSEEKTELETMTDISSWITEHLGTRLMITAAIYFVSINNGVEDGKTTRDSRFFNQIVGSCSIDIVRIASMDWDLVDPAVGEKREAGWSRHGWRKVWIMENKIFRLRSDDNSCLEMVREVLEIEPRFIKAQKQPGNTFWPLLGQRQIANPDRSSHLELGRRFLGSGYVVLFLPLQMIILHLRWKSQAARADESAAEQEVTSNTIFRAATLANFVAFVLFEGYAASKRMKWI